MKKVIIICDNCGKEIEEAEEADRMIEVKEPMCFPMHFCSWKCLKEFGSKYRSPVEKKEKEERG